MVTLLLAIYEKLSGYSLALLMTGEPSCVCSTGHAYLSIFLPVSMAQAHNIMGVI